MKNFIIKVSSFIAFLIIVLVIVSLENYAILNNAKYWELAKKPDYLVLGNSHPEYAFNDTRIPRLVNLGRSGEAYFYTYLKAKQVINNNKYLKSVFIEFGPSDINKERDDWIWAEDRIKSRFPRYSPLMDYSDFIFLWEKNSKAILNCLPSRYIEEIGYTNFSTLFIRKGFLSNTRFGGYQHSDISKIDSLINVEVLNKRFEETEDIEISEANIKYLRKIIELCEQNNIQVFLIRSPVHAKVRSRIQKFNGFLKSNFPNLEFLDFSNFPLEDVQYIDFGHLNSKGALIFSDWFSDLLDNKLLESSDKQIIINNGIKARTHNRVDRPASNN